MKITTRQNVREAWVGLTTEYAVNDALDADATPFQNMQIVDSQAFGKMLVLDDFVQTTERDEFIYHEMMVHVPMFSLENPKSVLIIGGGDGGALREVLRHPTVQRAVMVEIDERVIEFSRRHLPMICQEAFDDPRAEIVITDGAKFVAETKETFDVIIVDSSDPIGPATVLFERDFYRDLAARLTDRGIMVRQTGSSFMQPDELPQAMALAYPLFAHTAGYTFTVPTYVGGLFSAMYCSAGTDPHTIDAAMLQPRFEAIGGEFGYYTPGVHVGAFQLPGYIQKRIDAITPSDRPAPTKTGPVTFGWELTLDLYDCNPETIASEQAIQQYARQLCEVIGMVPYGHPQTPYFGENQEHTKGYSLLQFIETSSVVGHFSEGTGGVYINIFSCKAYDAEKAKHFTADYFGAGRTVARFTTRH